MEEQNLTQKEREELHKKQIEDKIKSEKNKKKVKIFNILKIKKYLWIMIVSTLIILIILPALQVLATGGIQNLDLWFKVISPINFLLIIIFSFAFGLVVSLQIYNFQDKTCSIEKKTGGVSSFSIGTFLAVLVPACPACLSLASLFLPAALGISVGAFFTRFSSLFLLLSIALMILGMLLLGCFKKS